MQDIATDTDPRLALHAACTLLSDRDPDRAGEQNQIGWNGYDSPFGHTLSGKAPLTWTPRMTEIAVKMLQKYVKQLARAGFDVTTIPSVETYAANVQARAAAIITDEQERRARYWRVDYDAARKEFVVVTPYDPNLIPEIRGLPGRIWNPTGDKTNRVPAIASRSAQAVLDFATRHKLVISPDAAEIAADLIAETAREIARVDAEVAASQAESADFDVPGLGGVLRPFQKAGCAYIAAHADRVLVADDMGLGKTVEALATVQRVLAESETSRAVIVCPATLKLNWLREAIKWLPEIVTVEGDLALLGRWGRRRVRGITILNGMREIEMKLADGSPAIVRCNDLRSRVLVLNYDILDKHMKMLRALKAEGVLRIVVFDESHYAKNVTAKRTKLSIDLATDVPARLCLTGTPIMNKPKELISQLNILNRLDDFGGFHAFVRRYCQVEYVGAMGSGPMADPVGLLDLNRALRATCMVRRRKADVLKELDPKIRTPMPLDITNREEYDRAEQALIAYIRERAAQDRGFRASLAAMDDADLEAASGLSLDDKTDRDDLIAKAQAIHAQDKAERAARAEVLVRIETLKQIAARGKLAAVVEWVEDFLATGEKLIVFVDHIEIAHTLATRFGAPLIIGDTPLAQRQKIVDAFQNDPEPRIVVMNIKAGGVGLTLTAASNVAFVELGWNPAVHDQAEDRAHRIGQTDSVTCWYFLGQRTIDEDIAELIEQKRRVVAATTDGILAARIAGESILGSLVDRLMGHEA